MEIILIAAMAANRVIGRENQIPWHLPDDLQWFKVTTMGHPLIMGRKTHESIGHALPGRENIVLTRQSGAVFSNCTVAHDLTMALDLCRKQSAPKAFIIGGEQIFKDGLRIADTILLNVLQRAVDGDVFFPPFSDQDFMLQEQIAVTGPEPYSRCRYIRRHQAR
ncbi:MAG: dihydrofolate reductase [Desulfobulbaceae bacterium]|uniref:Dihydrofolate reductase n=1 Tax=Candidatus Desulfatifera sulfidica TaxID=2841691 RepID=A0A8J6TC41_9BACT|nr:dihydrofolate reductase [Candidatus Desulfatifera sulfidica]